MMYMCIGRYLCTDYIRAGALSPCQGGSKKAGAATDPKQTYGSNTGVDSGKYYVGLRLQGLGERERKREWTHHTLGVYAGIILGLVWGTDGS